MQLKEYLDSQVVRFNKPAFIETDPISIPHEFNKKQDREIAGLWTAILSWGQRKTIINKARELMSLMDWSPHEFITQHQESDRKAFLGFKHRTFQAPDTLHFLQFLQTYYLKNESLETAFSRPENKIKHSIEPGLNNFREIFFEDPNHLPRTKKHIPSPIKGSACKRINMFLRWMVRKDTCGVDFGIWQDVSPAHLMIPLDVHVFNVAKTLKLLKTKQANWKAVLELTAKLRKFDADDPVKYDYALFNLGISHLIN